MTMTTDTTQTPAPAARATIDDVRTALGGTDPSQTNASKVRAMLGGRGSFETIQKHLVTLRQEKAIAMAPPVDAGAIPAMPADIAQMLWGAAWTAAQVQTMARAEKLAAERDAARRELETMGQDLADQAQTMDTQAANLDQADQAAAAAHAAHLADLEKAEADQAAAAAHAAQLARELENTRQELAKVRVETTHAAQIAEAGRAMMREELARLTDQLGELKAHLYKRADAAAIV